jgi:Histidine kinase-, DNA gyrase B-, and HSP90-like ATPase
MATGFTDDPARVEDALRAYTTAGFVACVVVPAVLTILPVVVLAAMAVPWRLADPEGLLLWALVAAHLPSAIWVRDALRLRDERAFRRAFFVQSQVQLQWLLLLTWRMGVQLPLVSIGVLFGMMLGWAFQDALLSHGAWFVRAQYLAAFVLFDAALLSRDAAHGRGLLHALSVDRRSAVSFLVNQAILAGLTQMVIATMGRTAREREEERQRALVLRVENERLSLEHHLLRRIAGLLAGGVSAGQLTHDIASPITVLGMNAEVLAEMLARETLSDLGEMREIVEDMRLSVDVLRRMSQATLQMIRLGGELKHREVSELVNDAATFARSSLREHKGRELRLTQTLARCAVKVSPLHAHALSNLMVNGVLHQAEDATLSIRGDLDGDAYRLELRDHGIDPEERPTRLANIRAAVSLLGDAAPTVRSGEYRGFGMGLQLARTLIVSSGGTFDLEEPPEGRGIVVVLRLPLEGEGVQVTPEAAVGDDRV